MLSTAKLDALQQMGITEPTLACFQQYIITLRELRALHPAHGTPAGISDSEFASRILAGTTVLDIATKYHIDDTLHRLDESDIGASEDPDKLSLALKRIFSSRDARRQLDAAHGAPPDLAPRGALPGAPPQAPPPANSFTALATAIEQLSKQINKPADPPKYNPPSG